MSAPEIAPLRPFDDDGEAPLDKRRWWPGRAAVGPALAIGLTLLILATPIILLFVVVLSAWTIHRFL